MKGIVSTVAAAAMLAAPAAWAADVQYKLLVLAMPNKYHYEYIPIARESLEKLAKLHAFEFTYTNKPEAFDGDLKQYAAVVFLNTPGEELNPAQRANFEAYMRAGGNAVIVHRAAITPPNGWVWYEKLVGRSFKIHPFLQTAAVDVAEIDAAVRHDAVDVERHQLDRSRELRIDHRRTLFQMSTARRTSASSWSSGIMFGPSLGA